jgi:hypothetical protein
MACINAIFIPIFSKSENEPGIRKSTSNAYFLCRLYLKKAITYEYNFDFQ